MIQRLRFIFVQVLFNITHAAKHILPIPVSRDQIIAELYASPEVAQAIGKMEPADLRQDIKQEMFIVLCELSEEKLRGMHERKELKSFLAGVMWRMVVSDRSTFYNTHRRYREKLLSTCFYVAVDGSILAGEDNETSVEEGEYRQATAKHYSPEEPCRLPELVNVALSELDPYEADMFKLYTQMGKTCQPIADATGIPVRSVRLAISQAREKLTKTIRNAH